LVTIWHAGWHDAHAHLVPSAVRPYRSIAQFAGSLSECTDTMSVA